MEERNIEVQLNLKVVHELVGRISFRAKDLDLSARDASLMKAALVVQTGLLFDFLSDQNSWRRWCSFLGMGTIDVFRLSDTLKRSSLIWRHYAEDYATNVDMSDGVPRSAADFKRLLRSEGLYWAFFAPFEELIDHYFDQPTPDEFRVLNQWSEFLTHVTLRDVDLDRPLIDEYVKQEKEMLDWKYDPDLLHALNGIVRTWFAPCEMALPSHGPGAIAGYKGHSKWSKYDGFRTDTRLQYFLRRQTWKDPELVSPFGFDIPYGLTRVSELICVPKSMTKRRTISKEPSSLQFYQKAVRDTIDFELKRSSLGDFINLEDQSLSQTMALRGSEVGSYATLDLSAASDSVTWPLVKAVTQGTWLLEACCCTRSDYTKHEVFGLLHLQKFAPMGSSCCFPVMCVVFASICALAVERVSGRKPRYNDFRVYGDDIVIKTRYAAVLETLLGDLHFTVNVKKSFTQASFHNFREACGVEAFDGVDVTAIRVPRKWRYECVNDEITIESVECTCSWIELTNALFQRGLVHAREACVSMFRAACRYYMGLPYSVEPSLLCDGSFDYRGYPRQLSVSLLTYDSCCTNFRIKRRFRLETQHGDCYQRSEYQCWFPYSRTELDSPAVRSLTTYGDDEYRYYEWWLSARKLRLDPFEDTRVVFDPIRLTWRKNWRYL